MRPPLPLLHPSAQRCNGLPTQLIVARVEIFQACSPCHQLNQRCETTGPEAVIGDRQVSEERTGNETARDALAACWAHVVAPEVQKCEAASKRACQPPHARGFEFIVAQFQECEIRQDCQRLRHKPGPRRSYVSAGEIEDGQTGTRVQ